MIREKEHLIDKAEFTFDNTANLLGRERRKAKEAAKKAKEAAKRAVKKTAEKAKEQAENVTDALKKAAKKLPDIEARYSILFPFKKTMKAELDKRNIATSNNLKSISNAFYKNVVKGSNVLEEEKPTDAELAAAAKQVAKEEGANVTEQQLLQAVKDAKQKKGNGIPSPSDVLTAIPDPTIQIAARALKAKEKATGQEMKWSDAIVPVAVVRFFKGLAEKRKRGNTTPNEDAIAKNADAETKEKNNVTPSEIVDAVLDGLIPTKDPSEKIQAPEEEESSNNKYLLLVAVVVLVLILK